MNQGPRWVLLMKKYGGGESRATVPLSVICLLHTLLVYCTLLSVICVLHSVKR
jgi:hypothetical protein